MFDFPLLPPMLIWVALITMGIWMIVVWNRLVRVVEERDDGTMHARGWPQRRPIWQAWPLNLNHRAVGRVQMRVLIFGIPIADRDPVLAVVVRRYRLVGCGLVAGILAWFALAAGWMFGPAGAALGIVLFCAVAVLSLVVNKRDCGPWILLQDGNDRLGEDR